MTYENVQIQLSGYYLILVNGLYFKFVTILILVRLIFIRMDS